MRAKPSSQAAFDPACRICPRLTALLDRTRAEHPGYFAKPVPAFGDSDTRLLIVGLAPGMHGANRTGRPFTGDFAGVLLYRTLHQFGFASRPESTGARDGLRLIRCRITNAVKCLPPDNKPSVQEIRACNRYLEVELQALGPGTAILALGGIAHRAVLAGLGLKGSALPFSHGARHEITDGRALFDCYHCSRYNTQTKRLTPAMFAAVFAAIARYLDPSGST